MRAFLLLALAAGCYSPSFSYSNGQLDCVVDCPSGYHCAIDGACWKDGQNPPPPPDAMPDAMIDAPPLPPDATEHLLTVNLYGDGIGTVSAPGLTCPFGIGTCTGSYVEGTQVTLQARTQNGDNSHFRQWSDACTTTFTNRDCTLTMDGPKSAGATFGLQNYNLVFVSSELYGANLGGAAAYDAKCNQLATAAGINNSGSNGFVSWMSDPYDFSNARDRLAVAGNPRHGFVRMDGLAFANRLEDGFNNVFFNPVFMTELGTVHPASVKWVWTGTSISGTSSGGETLTCQTWGDGTSGSVGTVGSMLGGPGAWTLANDLTCDLVLPIRCVGKTRDVNLPANPAIPPDGKVVFVTAGTVALDPGNGIKVLNDACIAEAATPFPGKTFKAMVATTTDPPSNSVPMNGIYYRPDGTLVTFGPAMQAGVFISGIWETATGTYLASDNLRVWTGSVAPNVVGSVGTTCNNWGNTAGDMKALVGQVNDLGLAWHDGADPQSICAQLAHVYCIEQ